MSDAHRGPTDPPPRPPWEIHMTGVRCPACGLGGDVPGSVVRTLCPRCGTEFDVLSALASRPRHGHGEDPDPGPRPAIPLGPATSGPAAAWRPPAPEAAPGPPPPRPAPPAPPAPPATAPAVDPDPPRHQPDATARNPLIRRLRAALLGLGLFGLGVLVGWTLTRVGDEGSQGGTAIGVTDASATRPRAADGSPRVDTSPGGSVRPSRSAGSSKRSSHSSTASKKRRSGSPPGHPGASSGSTADDGSVQGSDGAPHDASASTTTRHPSGGGPTTTTGGDGAPAASTTVAPASPAVPLLPASRACAGLDCHMTGSSGVEGIPVPDDAIAITRDGASGWTTQVASLEDLTTWYLDHLTDLGWVLDGPSSVMDPAQGAQRGLGHATSAVYCPTDPDHRAVAVNVGWPAGDDSGATIVLAIVTGVDQACS